LNFFIGIRDVAGNQRKFLRLTLRTFMKILIVDDEMDTVTTVKAFLFELAAEIDVAYNGKDGLNKLKQSPFDLLILDFMMSGMSGLDVCKIMKDNPKLRDIPVLLISALPITSPELDELLEEFNQTQMIRGVLEKPFSKKELLDEISRIVPAAA
jgi:two-component system, OmpR family, alkaline phosphatase synthesis response regulator PhoP